MLEKSSVRFQGNGKIRTCVWSWRSWGQRCLSTNEFPAGGNLGFDLHSGDLTHEDAGLPARVGAAGLSGLGDRAQGAAGWRGAQSALPCLRRDVLLATSSRVEAGVHQEGDAHGASVGYTLG